MNQQQPQDDQPRVEPPGHQPEAMGDTDRTEDDQDLIVAPDAAARESEAAEDRQAPPTNESGEELPLEQPAEG
jgi:hypothetical protein